MAKYVAVYFGKDEREKWREFLRAMNGVKIIQLTKEEIDENVKEFASVPYGTTNRIVLHDEEEVKLFKHVMTVFFPEKEYQVTDDPDDADFARWLQGRGIGIG